MKRHDEYGNPCRNLGRRIGVAAGMLGAALLAGCATGPKSPLDDPEAVSALMTRLGDALYGETDRCLPRQGYSVRVIDDSHLLFRQGDKVWINELRVRCPGLRRAERGVESLTFEPSGSRLCELDRVGVFDRLSRRPQVGPSCPLGGFRRVNEAIVEETLDLSPQR